MRLFTAIDLPGEVVASLERLLETLKPSARIKWSPTSNLHITTKFIGEWPEDRFEELKDALAAIRGTGPIEIAVERLGFFPNPHSPRVFWAGVKAGPELAALARATDEALRPLGIEPEKREYSPHLTLARIKEPVPMQPLRERIAALASLDFGKFTAREFCLYQSRVGRAGSVYTKLSEFPLTH
jgi:RNA 2',3'-cyclic 3'-phosphodiesterase